MYIVLYITIITILSGLAFRRACRGSNPWLKIFFLFGSTDFFSFYLKKVCFADIVFDIRVINPYQGSCNNIWGFLNIKNTQVF